MKPSDPIGAAIVEGMWIEDAGIAMMKQLSEAYSARQSQRSARADELEQARNGVQKSLQSDHDEAMHTRLRKIVGDADRLAEDAGSIASTAAEMAHTGEMAQMEMLGIVDRWRPRIEALCRSGLYLDAAMALFCVAGARAEIEVVLGRALEDVQALGTRLNANLATITPGSWATSGRQIQGGASGGGNGSGVQAVDHTTIKQDGGSAADTPSDRHLSGARDQPQQANANEKSDDEASGDDVDEQSNPRHRAGNADQHVGEGAADQSGSSRHMAGTAAQPGSSAVPATPPSLGGGGSGSGLSGASGLTSPAPGLGGLGKSMDPAGLSGAMKPPVSSLPSTAPAGGGGSGAGSGGSGAGAGAGRLGGGSVPSVAAPVTPIAPQAPAVSSSAATPAGSPTPGFGSSSPVAQSAPHAAGPVGGPMGGMPAGGGAVAGGPVTPPPPSQVGPAPTPSPGFSQGSGAPVPPAAAAANAGLGGSAISAGAAPFTSAAPERVDRFAQMAVEAVKMLAPGVASAPGLVLAAAVVAEQGGSQEIVIITNDGAGWLPEGFFLPPTILHAAVDLDDDEFDAKWFGWADPARTLIDYVVVRDKRSHREVRLLGLASMGPLSGQTKTIFPEAVPSVSAEREAQPLASDDRGRNAHRLKVQDKQYYQDVRRASETVRQQLANRALEAVMLTQAGSAIRPQWELLLRDGWLPESEWAALKARYEHERMIVGALRPGFTEESAPGQAAGLMYVNRFWELRAMETLLLWGREDCPVEDVVYTASQAGASIGPVDD